MTSTISAGRFKTERKFDIYSMCIIYPLHRSFAGFELFESSKHSFSPLLGSNSNLTASVNDEVLHESSLAHIDKKVAFGRSNLISADGLHQRV